ncbi:MAG: hypothetical protein AAF490_04060 [Chloroflexota bacterium]
MNLKNWKTWTIVGGFALVSAVATTGFVAAQDSDNVVSQTVTAVVQETVNHRRGGGRGQSLDAYAEALGVTVEDLETARDAAKVAMIEQAAIDGWITSDEADALIEDDGKLRLGRGQYYRGIYDESAFFAEALGVEVADLEAAKEALQQERIDAMIEAGRITEEQAAEFEAVQAFRDSIDKDAIFAEALGISEADLDAARDATTSYEDLLADLDLTAEEVAENAQAVMESIVNDAVEDGTLTEEQAERLLNGRDGRDGRGGRGNGGRGNGNGPRNGNGNGNAVAPGQNA